MNQCAEFVKPILRSGRLRPVQRLVGLINNPGADHRLEDQVRALRKQMATDYGFVLPAVRLLDNLALQSNEYILFIRSEEHTSELQSLMRISYAVICLNKKSKTTYHDISQPHDDCALHTRREY